MKLIYLDKNTNYFSLSKFIFKYFWDTARHRYYTL